MNEVSKVLEYCNQNRIGVVPQGGNTGLVGGAVGLVVSENNKRKRERKVERKGNLRSYLYFPRYDSFL